VKSEERLLEVSRAQDLKGNTRRRGGHITIHNADEEPSELDFGFTR